MILAPPTGVSCNFISFHWCFLKFKPHPLAHHTMNTEKSGLGCSILMMSLVNVSLKFKMLISDIRQYFLLKKCEKLLQCKSFFHLFNKNISVCSCKVFKHLKSWPLNEFVKLTMLWTTGPRFLIFNYFRPPSGSMLLYNRNKVRHRKDNYCWKKRKDGKTIREDHMKLKVQGLEVE